MHYNKDQSEKTEKLNELTLKSIEQAREKEHNYKELHNVVDAFYETPTAFLVDMAKLKKYKQFENQIGCSLDIAHSVQPGKVVRVLFPDNHIYRCIVDKVSYFGFTLSGEPDYLDFIYFKQYKQIWWLKEDRSE